MESFIARYASPNLVGIDFDIEGGQSESDIQNLVAAAAGAQSQYPHLQFSFTLATLAASDGSYGGVNSLGNEVVEAVLGSGLQHYVINLMTMDYGSASSSVCVVVSGSCEMAQSAIQAVENLEHTYGIPASKIAVTPMIGLNDNTAETFTTADVDTLKRQFEDMEVEVPRLLAMTGPQGQALVLPAYDRVLKASHLFNLMDARGAIAVAERQSYIGRIRDLCKLCAAAWVENERAA